MTGKALLTVKTAVDVLVVISSRISRENVVRLTQLFEEVLVVDIPDNLENEMTRQDALLLSCLKSSTTRSAIVVAPGVLVSAQCDHLFDSEDDGVLVQDKESKHWLMVRITPNSWEAKKIEKILSVADDGKTQESALKYPNSKEPLVALKLNSANIDKLEEEDGVKFFYVDAVSASGDELEIWERFYASQFSNLDEERKRKDWIAVVGMSCKFPHANNLHEYWGLLNRGLNTCGSPPTARLSLVEGMDEGTKGNFLACPIDQFDAPFFGMSPNEAALTDPQARLLLECSWEALEHANINPDQIRGSKTGVFYGDWLQDYRDHLIQQSPTGQDFLRKYLANGLGGTAAKLSFFYGLTGPNMAIENACSASMVALHLACASLRRRECPLAFVCGTNLILQSAHQAKVLSKDGLCKAFDARGDGYSRAEGIAVLLLKRYSDAIRDGDKIQAVIRSSAVSQEGTSKSFGTPTVDSECRVMRTALTRARLDPSQVDYVEAHATGTCVGDPTEAAAISKAYTSTHARETTLWIGSGKTNIGHTEACSGLTGIIKVILSIQNNKVPKHLHLTQLNPAVNFDSIPGAIPVEAQPWPRNSSRPRIAGVNSFGISGTYAHTIIQEAPLQYSTPNPQETEIVQSLLLVSAKCPDALENLLERLSLYLESSSSYLSNICFTAATCRSHHSHRLALLANNREDMRTKIREAKSLVSFVESTSSAPRVLFTFPGVMGKQKLGPIRQLYKTNLYFRQTMQECDSIFKEINPDSGSLVDILFSTNPSGGNVTPNYFLLLTTYQYALAKLWNFYGVKAEMVVGHCAGEYAAALTSGMLSLSEFYKLSHFYRIMMEAQQRCSVQMVVLKTDESLAENCVNDFLQTLQPAHDAWLDIACKNARNQTVVTGPAKVARKFAAYCTARGLRATPFSTFFPVHSRALEDVGLELLEVLNELSFQPGKLPLLSSTTGEIISNLDSTHIYRVFRESVNFTIACDSVLAQQDHGNDVLLEMSVDSALSKMASENFGEHSSAFPIHCLPSFHQNSGDVMQSLGKLYELGVNLNWRNFYRSIGFRGQKVTNLPGYPFQRKSHWLLRKPISTVAECLWELAPFYQPRQIGGGEDLPKDTIENLATELNQLNVYSPEENLLDRDMNRLCYLYVVKALRDLGCEKVSLSCILPDKAIGLAQELGVVPHLSTAFPHFLNYIFEEPDAEQDLREPTKVLKEINKIKEQPHVRKYAALPVITACGENLAGVLNGTVNPHKILFNPKNVLAEVYYRETRFMKNYQISSEIFSALVSRWKKCRAGDAGETLRILEVGAGTGLFTKLALPHLLSSGTRFEYHFTDISPTLLRQSRKALASLFPTDRMVFSVLNLENDALAQGFPPKYFDVVVAVDVLHATKNLLNTLTNLMRICSVGATVLLSETERPIPELDICFGILDGYWHFEDRQLRSNHCTVSSETWLNLLAQVGFTQEPTTILCCNGQKSVVMATSSNTMKDEQSEIEHICEENWLLFEIGNQYDGDDLDVRRIQSQVKKWSGRGIIHARVDAEMEGSCLMNWVRDQLLRVQNLEGVLVWFQEGIENQFIESSGRLVVYELAQHWLASTKSSVLPKLVLITENGNPVYQNPSSSLARGIVKYALEDIPGLKAKCLDLDPAADLETKLEHLLMEMWLEDKETEVAYRDGGKRYVRNLKGDQNLKYAAMNLEYTSEPKNNKLQSTTFSNLLTEARNVAEKTIVIQEFLQNQIVDTLGMAEEEVDPHTNFADMSMDSLMSIEFTNKIYSNVKGLIKIEHEDFIDLDEHNTLEKLTHFMAQILEEKKI